MWLPAHQNLRIRAEAPCYAPWLSEHRSLPAPCFRKLRFLEVPGWIRTNQLATEVGPLWAFIVELRMRLGIGFLEVGLWIMTAPLGDGCPPYLMTPLCSGISPQSVAMPANTQVEPLRLAQRTLTKSRGPTRFPAAAAASSWVMTVSLPIFCRT